jgi:4a-hydroxytetrahydrobiopterin dehydratase
MDTHEELRAVHCVPCEGRGEHLSAAAAGAYLAALTDWRFVDDGRRIRRELRVKDFATALDFLQRVGVIAEQEGHHPDLHLTCYREIAVELWTFALGGLSLNDFILAARIDEVSEAYELIR